MVEYRGNTYQTGNATPNTARRVLKALAKAGAANGSVCKGSVYKDYEVICGELRMLKEYFATFTELGVINADAIVKAKDGNPIFFYEI